MKHDFRRLFLDADGPVADQMQEALDALTDGAFAEQQHEQAGLLCHRLRGDARTVGFLVIGELTGAIEVSLRNNAAGQPMPPGELARVRALAGEVTRRMKQGPLACDEPLSDELKQLLSVGL